MFLSELIFNPVSTFFFFTFQIFFCTSNIATYSHILLTPSTFNLFALLFAVCVQIKCVTTNNKDSRKQK